MNARVIGRLIAKDCSLMRVPIVAYTTAAIIGLILTVAFGTAGRAAGITLTLNVLIGVSFHVLLGPVLGERERKTLAFVMSLPVTRPVTTRSGSSSRRSCCSSCRRSSRRRPWWPSHQWTSWPRWPRPIVR